MKASLSYLVILGVFLGAPAVPTLAQECSGQPNGTPCTDDGEECTDDFCIAGVCEHPPLSLGTSCTSDGMDCTDDVCIGGVCEHPPSFEGEPCTDDGNECTFDQCDGAGTCIHNPAPAGVPCGDPSDTDCTNPDLCDGAGNCEPANAPNGTPCDDGQYCTRLDICADGVCIGGGFPCAPGDVCDEAGDICIECEADADCDDLNVCTADFCSSNVCGHDPLAATSCGSSVDNDCTDPDTCDGFGVCQPNDLPDGTACGVGGTCQAGICDPSVVATYSLSEGDYVASRPTGLIDILDVPWIDGVAQDAMGISHAVVWEPMPDGTHDLVTLDASMTESAANGGACDTASGACVVIGHVDNHPMAWVYDGMTMAWLAEKPNLPGGATAGILMDGELEFGGTAAATPIIAAGYSYDGQGRISATVWKRDEMGNWLSVTLPHHDGLVFESEAVVVADIGDSGNDGLTAIGGGVETASANRVPAVWLESDPGTGIFADDPILLPLVAGMVGGKVTTIGGQQGEEVAAGAVTTASGHMRGALWACDPGFMNCSVSSYPSLPGYGNALVTSLLIIDPGHYLIAGVSYNVDPSVDGVATQWMIDTNTLEVIATTNLNDVASGIPSGCVLGLYCWALDENGAVLGVGAYTCSMSARGDAASTSAGLPEPHAVALAGLPSGCECGVPLHCDDGDTCTNDACVDCLCEHSPRIYGDVDGNGVLNLFDIFCILEGIGGEFDTCSFADVDIEPCGGNGTLNLFDVFAVMAAIGGEDPCCGG
jgi:hypothetical protein